MMMTNGNLPMSHPQKKALLDFVRSGKGFIGAHCAALTFYNYPEFGEMLGGYYRRSVLQNRIGVLTVEDPSHPATKMLGGSWPLVDEFYHFGTAPWDAAYPACVKYTSCPAAFPVVWCALEGVGHNNSTYMNVNYSPGGMWKFLSALPEP
jgi:type 1 glutamine amidotransferase